MNRILAYPGFVSSPRLCRFLRFIVERTLENDLDRLKEFSVALEVFDRDDKYDPAIDSIVRVEARRLRSKLKAYYEGDGRKDSVLIGLRPGSYVPLFRSLQSAPPQAAPAGTSIEAGDRPPPNRPQFEAAGTDDAAVSVTVAVLPFVNMSPEPAQDYFCDGITEEIINALASVEGLSLVARTSAFQFKGKHLDIREVGNRLGAQVIVEGSVRKSSDQLRITAQAIRADTGYHLWSETFRQKLEDVFAIQEEISSAVANVLRVKLGPAAKRSGAKSPPSMAAYTGYLQARFLVNQQTPESLAAALDQYQSVIRDFPDYAPPYAGLATVYGFMSLFGVVSGREVIPQIRRNLETAVRLDPESPDVCAVVAGVSAHLDYEWRTSEERFKKTFELQPSHADAHRWHGMALLAQGRFAEAEAELRKATRMNPLSSGDFTRLGYAHYVQGDHASAMARFETAFALEPDFPEGSLFLALLLVKKEDYAAASEVLTRHMHRQSLAVHMGLLAAVSFKLGDVEKSRRILHQLDELVAKRYVTPMATALAFTGMGEIDAAIDALDRAITDRTPFLIFMNVDPFYDPLRKNPRFPALLRRLNLTA